MKVQERLSSPHCVENCQGAPQQEERYPQLTTKVTPSSSQVNQCCNIVPNNVNVIAINSVSNYSVYASLFGKQVSFLVDTGAAVSLICGEIWEHIKLSEPPKLTPIRTRLVGADGSPLQVQGSAVVELTISGQVFKQEFIIADSLASEGILSLNFLESNRCIVDLIHGELIARGSRVALSAKDSAETTNTEVDICVQDSFTVAALSEMEVMGEIPEHVRETG